MKQKDITALKTEVFRTALLAVLTTVDKFEPTEDDSMVNVRALLTGTVEDPKKKRKLSAKMLKSMRRNAKIARAKRMANLKLKAMKASR